MQPRPLGKSSYLAACVIATLTVLPGDALGQAAGVRVAGALMPAWGTTSTSVLRLGSASFIPGWASNNWASDLGWRHGVDALQGSILFGAEPQLPSGALITGFAVEVYDDSPSKDATVEMAICPNLTFSCTFTPVVSTSGTTGASWLTSTLASPVTIDNNANLYFIRVQLGAGDNSMAFRSVLINYQLQVSPAPAVATFSDVPTSYWAFQYIEALKASGITQGVTPTTFEPESNVTRAQMAVFLAKALGLHWPN